jgi:spore coat protein U-like protein
MMRRLLFWTLLLPLFCAGFGEGARAAPNCVYSSGSAMNFGTLYVASTYTFSAVGSATVLCTNLTGSQVARVCGKFNQPGTKLYAAASPTSYIVFNIYKDSQRSFSFVNDDSDLTPINLDAMRASGAFRVYGRIPNAGGDNAVSTGSYIASSVGFYFYYRIFPDAVSANAASCSSGSPFVYGGYAPVPVSATVSSGCAIAAQPMTFPQQGVITTPVLQTSTLTVKCSDSSFSPWVGLDNGVNSLSGQRRMSSGAGYIDYELYTNAARTQRWGVTQNTDTVSVTPSVAGTSITVYGKIPVPLSQPTGGTYTDVVTATVHF